MNVKYLLNLNPNHQVDEKFVSSDNLKLVFNRPFTPSEYKDEKMLRGMCYAKILQLESLEKQNEPAIGFDEPVYVIYSGLAVVMLTFINELVNEGYRPIVLFEDKDNGGYYKMEVNY